MYRTQLYQRRWMKLLILLLLTAALHAEGWDVEQTNWGYYNPNVATTSLTSAEGERQNFFMMIEKNNSGHKILDFNMLWVNTPSTCTSSSKLRDSVLYFDSHPVNMQTTCVYNDHQHYKYLFKSWEDMNYVVDIFKRSNKAVLIEDRKFGLSIGISATGFTKAWNSFGRNKRIANDSESPFLRAEKECQNQNRVKACIAIGSSYMKGNGVKQNTKKGMKYLKKACKARRSDLGSGGACALLAYEYYLGTSVPKNTLTAKDYFQQACSLGDSKSCSYYKELIDYQPTQDEIVGGLYQYDE